jgi:hypothetical protein
LTDKSDPGQELGEAESEAIRFLEPELAEYAALTSDLFNLIAEALSHLPAVTLREMTQSRKVGTALLLRLGNDLRCIALLALRGYPTQAAALAASMYEVAYSLICIGADESRAQAWITHDDPTKPFRNVRKLTEEVIKVLQPPDIQNQINRQYRIYRQLAMAKHANPLFETLQAYELGATEFRITNGPRTSPSSVQGARFALEHAAGLSFMALVTFVNNHLGGSQRSTFARRLAPLGEQIRHLNAESVRRYGTEDPFPGKW